MAYFIFVSHRRAFNPLPAYGTDRDLVGLLDAVDEGVPGHSVVAVANGGRRVSV